MGTRERPWTWTFWRAAIVETGGNARAEEGVVAYRRGNPWVPCAALKHAPGIGLALLSDQVERRCAASYCGKRTLAIAGEAGGSM